MDFESNDKGPPKNLDLQCRCLTIDDMIASIFEKAKRPSNIVTVTITINPDQPRRKDDKNEMD